MCKQRCIVVTTWCFQNRMHRARLSVNWGKGASFSRTKAFFPFSELFTHSPTNFTRWFPFFELQYKLDCFHSTVVKLLAGAMILQGVPWGIKRKTILLKGWFIWVRIACIMTMYDFRFTFFLFLKFFFSVYAPFSFILWWHCWECIVK